MLIKVKVFPRTKKEKIVKKEKDSFEIFVREKPEKGLANQRVKEILASYFNLSENRIKLIKGGKSKNKIFEIMK